MKGGRAVPLAEVGYEILGILQRFTERFLANLRIRANPQNCRGTYEIDCFWHFDLSEDSAPEIRAKFAGVANLKSIWTLHDDFRGFTAVELYHSLDFAESHKVAILEPVPCLVQAGNNCLLSLSLAQMMISRSQGSQLTLSISAIIPVSGCSPVGSMQVN